MCTQLVLPLCCVCKLTQEKLWELHVNFFGSSLNDLEALTVAKKIVLLGVVAGETLKLKLNSRICILLRPGKDVLLLWGSDQDWSVYSILRLSYTK